MGGGTALTPTGSTGMLSTAWTSASTAASPTFNLGSFNPAAGDTLILNGGSILTYQNNGGTVSNTNQYLNYGVNTAVTPAGSLNLPRGVNLPLENANATGNTGDQRFATETTGSNLLSGLNPGTCVLATYGHASGVYENNSGAHFAATFSVVPESRARTCCLVLVVPLDSAWFYVDAVPVKSCA